MAPHNNDSSAFRVCGVLQEIDHRVCVSFLHNGSCERLFSDSSQLAETEDLFMRNVTDVHTHLHWNEMVWADSVHHVTTEDDHGVVLFREGGEAVVTGSKQFPVHTCDAGRCVLVITITQIYSHSLQEEFDPLLHLAVVEPLGGG